MCPPCVRFGHASKLCVCHVALGVRSLSLSFLCPVCPLVVRFLPALCRPLVRSGLALAEPLSALCPLFGLCAFVSALVRLVEVSVLGLAVPLLGVSLLAFSRVCLRLPQSFAAHLHPVFCPGFLYLSSLSEFCLRRPASGPLYMFLDQGPKVPPPNGTPPTPHI